MKHEEFKEGMNVVAAGDIRSNDSLFFIGDRDLKMAAHEFGHHIGNRDEYKGALIDDDSIMGQNTKKVKRRHLGLVAKVFGNAMSAAYGKSWTHKPVPA